MSFRIGPSYCGECGEDYGHADTCSKSVERPDNWPVSKKAAALAKTRSPDDRERLQKLIALVQELADQVENRN